MPRMAGITPAGSDTPLLIVLRDSSPALGRTDSLSTMLNESVIFSGLLLVVASCALFLTGERMKASHWGWSQLCAAGMTTAAWLAQRALTGHALPRLRT